MPHSFGSRITRSCSSPLTTSMRIGPTEASMRSAPRVFDDRTTRWSSPHFDRHEGVGHAEVRVLAHADDAEQLLVGPVHLTGAVDVEVVPVVEVAVRGADVADRLADLVDRVVVEGGEHVGLHFSGGAGCRCPPRGGLVGRAYPHRCSGDGCRVRCGAAARRGAGYDRGRLSWRPDRTGDRPGTTAVRRPIECRSPAPPPPWEGP